MYIIILGVSIALYGWFICLRIYHQAYEKVLAIQNKGRMHFWRDILLGNHKEKTKKDSIIVLSNGIHPRHMIYLVIIILIQMCVCYYTPGTGLIIVLQFAVNGYVIPILKWRFHSHRIAQIIHVVVMTLMRLNLLVYYMWLDQSLLKLFKED